MEKIKLDENKNIPLSIEIMKNKIKYDKTTHKDNFIKRDS